MLDKSNTVIYYKMVTEASDEMFNDLNKGLFNNSFTRSMEVCNSKELLQKHVYDVPDIKVDRMLKILFNVKFFPEFVSKGLETGYMDKERVFMNVIPDLIRITH